MTGQTPRGRASAAQRVADEIRGRMAEGVYPPNTYLPSERELAEDLGAGRRSVRGGLALLVREGLAVRAAGRGTRVLSPLDHLTRQVIGIVHTRWSETPPEYMRILEGCIERLARLHYRHELLAYPKASRGDGGEPGGLFTPDELCERFGAFIFIETRGHEAEILELERRRVPVVVANLEVELDVTATWVDHRAAAREAVKLLVGFGHRRIGFIGRPPDVYFYGKALEGFRAGLFDAALPTDDDLVVFCKLPDPLSAYVAAKRFLAMPEQPTGIVAARDVLAHGVCRVMQEAGRVIGRDISVVGFDNVTWPLPEPFLTTFREPCVELGATAADLLVERLVGGWREPERRQLPASLVLRRSLGPRIEPGEDPLADA